MNDLQVIRFSCLHRGFWDFQGANLTSCVFGATKASYCAKYGHVSRNGSLFRVNFPNKSPE